MNLIELNKKHRILIAIIAFFTGIAIIFLSAIIEKRTAGDLRWLGLIGGVFLIFGLLNGAYGLNKRTEDIHKKAMKSHLAKLSNPELKEKYLKFKKQTPILVPTLIIAAIIFAVLTRMWFLAVIALGFIGTILAVQRDAFIKELNKRKIKPE